MSKVIGNISAIYGSIPGDLEIRRVICEINAGEPFRAESKQAYPNARAIEHFVFDRANYKPKSSPRKFCGQPNRRLVIATNGDVFPCCVDYSGKLKLGNIWRDGLEKLWRKSRSLAHRLQRGSWPSACVNCTSYASYDCEEAECLSR